MVLPLAFHVYDHSHHLRIHKSFCESDLFTDKTRIRVRKVHVPFNH